jgi:hypothetical protein
LNGVIRGDQADIVCNECGTVLRTVPAANVGTLTELEITLEVASEMCLQIYLHSFIVTASGDWAVVQQGMNGVSGFARRYHWHSASVRDFFDTPHTGIVGERQGTVMNLVDTQARPPQNALLTIAHENPETTLKDIRHLTMPRHHDVRAEDVDLKRLGAVLAVAYDRDLRGFADLLLVENLGPRTLQTLAMVAEVIHGTPVQFSDPARYSFALGGKDRHPFPVPLKTYDESIGVLRRSLDAAKVDGGEKLDCFGGWIAS